MGKTILVVSDTHGSNTTFRTAVDIERGHFDEVYHLGDVCDGEQMIRSIAECPVIFVKGNCDGFSRLPGELDFTESGHHIFMAHGHRYFVGFDASGMVEEARKRGADVALYGHTHVPYCEMIDGILAVNPGSLSRPRGYDRRPSYAILRLEPFKVVECEIKYIGGK